ncbi:MAG TPA: hypothetical protein VGC21_03490 [Telluria sp.]|jgi:hypothetical protein
MQRKLAYALSPAPALPLVFLLTAPWFALLAALVLLAAGEAAFLSRWSMPTLAATHLLTLGYLSMAMAGSMLQLIPVVTGSAPVLGRRSAALAWGGMTLGTLLLATALGRNLSALFVPAAVVLASAFTPLLVCLARVLAQPAALPAMPMVRGMRIALAALVLTLGLGMMLASGFGGLATVLILLLVDLHALWGLLGWVVMLVLCVAFQVVPMFQSSRLYPAPVALGQPAAVGSAAGLECAAHRRTCAERRFRLSADAFHARFRGMHGLAAGQTAALKTRCHHPLLALFHGQPCRQRGAGPTASA